MAVATAGQVTTYEQAQYERRRQAMSSMVQWIRDNDAWGDVESITSDSLGKTIRLYGGEEVLRKYFAGRKCDCVRRGNGYISYAVDFPAFRVVSTGVDMETREERFSVTL